MMKRLLATTIIATTLISFTAWAQEATPVGLWKNIDDQTGKPKALIRITEDNGEYKGKIEKPFRDATEEQNPKCDKCEGALRDQPVIGMTILSGMKHEDGEYAGGKILDPGNGKLY